VGSTGKQESTVQLQHARVVVGRGEIIAAILNFPIRLLPIINIESVLI
jgi:hypothetical protein